MLIGDDFVKVSYNKLWKLLIDRNITASDIRKQTGLSSCTMTNLRRNEPVSLTVLLKIAESLKCDISDMCDFQIEEER